MSDRKATWDEAARRIAEFPSRKDRAHLTRWVEHRKETELIAPGTLRNYLKVLSLASRDLGSGHVRAGEPKIYPDVNG